jgi:hypothetical protein
MSYHDEPGADDPDRDPLLVASRADDRPPASVPVADRPDDGAYHDRVLPAAS